MRRNHNLLHLLPRRRFPGFLSTAVCGFSLSATTTIMTSTPPDISQLHISQQQGVQEFDAFNDHQQPKTFHYATSPPPASLNPQFQYAPVTMGQQGLKKPARAGLPSVGSPYSVISMPAVFSIAQTDPQRPTKSTGLIVILLKILLEIAESRLMTSLEAINCLPALVRRPRCLRSSLPSFMAARCSSKIKARCPWARTMRSSQPRLSSRTFLSPSDGKPYSTSLSVSTLCPCA